MRIASGLAVAGGGAAGAFVRWGVFEMTGGDSRWALLALNTAGAFVLGIVIEWTTRREREMLRLGLGVGFCGSLTTFSAFAVLIAELSIDGNAGSAVTFTLISLVTAIAAIVSGTLIAANSTSRR